MNENPDEELQFAVVGDFLLGDHDIDDLYKKAMKHGLTAEAFTNKDMRTAYEMILNMRADKIESIRNAVNKKIGCSLVCRAIDKSSLLRQDAYSDIRKLANRVTNAKINKEFLAVLNNPDNSSQPRKKILELEKCCRSLKDQISSEEDDTKGISLADIADPTPEEQNPDALVRGKWLRKGHGAVLASVTGVGKSVISMQLAYAWALGRETLGLAAIRPLKIAIFQTEDDDEELAFFKQSMRAGFKRYCGWTEEDLKKAEKNIRFYQPNGKTGEEFFDLMAEVQFEHQHDLVIINPLMAVCGCNLLDNKEMTELLYKAADRVIKSSETACGLLIIHHTNKPSNYNGRQGFGSDQYAAYLGAGASAIANWMRAMVAILPVGKTSDYQFIAAKRGENLGWPPNGKSSKPTRIIRHTPPKEKIAFWLEDGMSAQPSAASEPPPAASESTVQEDARLLADELKKEPKSLTDARKVAWEQFKPRTRGAAALDAIRSNPAAYGLTVAQASHSRMTAIGTPAAVAEYLSNKSA